jgi:hypothetical protein
MTDGGDTPSGEIQVGVEYVPRHYKFMGTVTADGMRRLIVGLRRLVDEYDTGEECEQLLAVFVEAFNGDLPTAPSAPIDGDEPPTATAT